MTTSKLLRSALRRMQNGIPPPSTNCRQLAKNGTNPRPLEDYVGTYWDDIHAFKIEVMVEDGTLHWALQGLESEKFRLDQYEEDIFTWILPRNELAKRGRWVDQGADFWKVEFKANDKGEIDYLLWVHDIGVPAVKYTKPVKGTL
jgi:hypothetical protein